MQLVAIPLGSRRAAVNEAAIVGHTGIDGVIEIHEVTNNSSSRIVTNVSGFVARDLTDTLIKLANSLTPIRQVVTLERGAVLTVRCVDIQGERVPNATVAIARDYISLDELEHASGTIYPCIPGANSRTAMFVGRSDQRGEVVFQELENAIYIPVATAANLVSIEFSKHRLDLPGDNLLTITFGSFFSTILEIKGDSLVSGKVSIQGSHLAMGGIAGDLPGFSVPLSMLVGKRKRGSKKSKGTKTPVEA
ncbi:MAG: hypothetical protein ACKVS6_12805 [Planctomycetota bacterium]